MLVDHWIDVHGHVFPPMTADEGAEITRRPREVCWCIKEPVHWNPAPTLAYMDRTGIQMQMQSYVPPDVNKLREANDYGAGVIREHPDRFGLLGALPMGRTADDHSGQGRLWVGLRRALHDRRDHGREYRGLAGLRGFERRTDSRDRPERAQSVPQGGRPYRRSAGAMHSASGSRRLGRAFQPVRGCWEGAPSSQHISKDFYYGEHHD